MVNFGARTSYTNKTFNPLHFGVFFRIFEIMVDFYDLQGPSALRKYALTAARGLTDQPLFQLLPSSTKNRKHGA